MNAKCKVKGHFAPIIKCSAYTSSVTCGDSFPSKGKPLAIAVTLLAFPLRGRFPHSVGEMSRSDKRGRLRQRGTAERRWMRCKSVQTNCNSRKEV